jgi:RNase adapter protein RapZ
VNATPIRLVILTGLSGSGKSTALHALEDLGYFCIDNLPILLLPRLLELGGHTTEDVSRLALVVDAREGDLLEETPAVIDAARAEGHAVEVVFLDAGDEVLLRRYSETRRRHPLAEGGSVESGIAAERRLLADLRQAADQVVDTSAMNVHELKALLQDRFRRETGEGTLSVTLLSFGFKHGLPPQADLVLDCRFLPNPHFVEELRPHTGLDAPVADYVLGREETGAFLERVRGLVSWLLPLYVREGKAHLTVAIGCTGGRHRSVAIAERLGQSLRDEAGAPPITVRHRDVAK